MANVNRALRILRIMIGNNSERPSRQNLIILRIQRNPLKELDDRKCLFYKYILKYNINQLSDLYFGIGLEQFQHRSTQFQRVLEDRKRVVLRAEMLIMFYLNINNGGEKN